MIESVCWKWDEQELRSGKVSEGLRRLLDVETDGSGEDTIYSIKKAPYELDPQPGPDLLRKKGDKHPDPAYPYAVVNDVIVRRLAETIWLYTELYELPFIGAAGIGVGEGPAEYENPLDVPFDEDLTFIREMVPVDRDRNGNPIQSSSQQWFDPPPLWPKWYTQLIVTRNQPLFDTNWHEEWLGCTNQFEWRGWEPGSVMVWDIKPHMHRYGEGIFFRVTYTFIRRRDRDEAGLPIFHKLRVLDMGDRERTEVGEGEWAWKPIRMNDEIIRSPVRLDTLGRALAIDAPAAWMMFDMAEQKDFGELNLEPPEPPEPPEE